MATTGDWRDRWEERDRHGLKVLDVWEREGKPLAYQYEDTGYSYETNKTVYVDDLVNDLIPKAQPARPKKYRPYTEAELWDVIQQHKGVLWVCYASGPPSHTSFDDFYKALDFAREVCGWVESGTPHKVIFEVFE